MTNLVRALRVRLSAPAYAVHFHDDREQDESACFDPRCGRLPLSTR